MKRLVLIIIAACTLYACKEHNGYTIIGDLADANGMEIVLKKVTIDSDEPVEINKCVIKKGKFKMIGTVEFPEYCILYVGDNGPLPLFVENTIIEIAIDLANIQQTKVTGSMETDLLMDYLNVWKKFEEKIEEINEEYITMLISDELDDEKQTEFISQINTIQQQRLDYLKLVVEENPNSVFTSILLQSALLSELEYEELEKFANGFDDVISKSPWVQMFKESAEIAKHLAIGQPFIELTMSNPDGNEISLSNYVGKNKYVLIDFWAAWCQPCRNANPRLLEIYKKYKDKGFEIVGVSLDRDKEQWIKAIEDDKLPWPQMSDLAYWNSEGAKLYSVSSIPHAVLLDKEGNILTRGIQLDELEDKLKEMTKDN